MSKSSLIKEKKSSEFDWIAMFVPLGGVVALGVLFMLIPDQSAMMLGTIRGFLGNDMGLYYLLIGVLAFGATMYIAFSKYGNIKLGGGEKPQYKSFAWGAMIFTSTMAADILFFALIEWSLYASEPYMEQLGDMQLWASTYPLFHWGPIAWGIYIVLAVAFGFMLHVRLRNKQKFSEGCRPLFGNKVDGLLGKVIDTLASFALIAGLASSFSLATPLLSAAFSRVFGIGDTVGLTISILIVIALIYTIAVLIGMKGISKLATVSVYIFATLLFYFLFLGGETRYILETGFSAIGNLAQNFFGMATRTDPLRETTFTQDWTVFYWAYWMACSVATPFFIGIISKGRTIKNTIVGAYCWGLAGTFTTFIILGNYGLSQQMKHGIDTVGTIYNYDYSINSSAIISIFETLPLPALALVILGINMILFYSTTLDAMTMVISSYSHKKLMPGQEPDRRVRAFWAILFVIFPIALIFSENSLYSLQSVSIIAAFPIGIVITLIVISFFKDARNFLNKKT